MKIVVLGAAAGGGYPQWNCGCAVCTLAWRGDPRVRRATQSSVAVSADGTSWVVLNASPDIGTQIADTPALHPRASGRHSPIAAVVLTNGDIDHIAGLLSLKERQSFKLMALVPVRAALAANPIFSALSAAEKVEAVPEEPVILAGLEVTLVAVPGKVPLYLESADPEIGGEGGETAGVLVRQGEQSLVYVPGCAAITPDLQTRLATADVVMFDGTLFTDREMIKAGLGSKTGRRMGHVPVSGEGGSLPVLSALPSRHKVYVHMNNTNPLWVEGSPEREMVEQAGIAVAYDGMEITL